MICFWINRLKPKIFSLYLLSSLHFFLFVLQYVFNFHFPHLLLSVLRSVMSWFSFFSLPQAYFSSHLHHPPIPFSLICYLVFFFQCLFFPKDPPGCFFSVFLLSSAFTFTFFSPSLKNFNYIPTALENSTCCIFMGCLQKLLMFGPCGPHLSYRCEKCMNACISALRLDIDSITHSSVVECLNERHSLMLGV